MTDPSLSKKGSRRSDGSLIKADGEHGSYGLAVFCLYGSSLTGYDHARQCKPNPKAFTVGILALIEALKDVGQILRRNARAVVLNYNFGIQGVFGCVNFDPAALGGVFMSEKKYVAAAYMRLSKKPGDYAYDESESIES